MRFLDELPRLYREKEEALIKEIRDKIAVDEEVSHRFDMIVNTKQSFKEKLEALKELSLSIKSKDAQEYTRKYVVERLGELKVIADQIDLSNAALNQELQMFTFESN